LDRTYPDQCPHPSWTDRDIWMKAGSRRVFEGLRSLFEEQTGKRYVYHVDADD
jgi:hypothetical protein